MSSEREASATRMTTTDAEAANPCCWAMRVLRKRTSATVPRPAVPIAHRSAAACPAASARG